MREASFEFESIAGALAFLLGTWRREFLALLRRDRPAMEHLHIRIQANGLTLDQSGRSGRRTLARLDLGDTNLSELLLNALARSTRNRDVVLQVDRTLVLTRAIAVAKAPRTVLRKLLGYEVERLAPVPGSDVYFDFVRKKDSMPQVSVRIVERAPLNRAIDALHQVGLRVGRIVLEGEIIDADPGVFPVDRGARLRRLWRTFGTLALATLAAILLFAWALAWELRQEFANDALAAQRSSLSMQASEIALRERRMADARAQLSWLEQERQQHLFGVTLATLTRLLPQDSWLRELSFDGSEFHASGFAKNATALIGAIDQSGEFAGAQFAAPVVHDASMDADRFELTFQPGRSTPP